MLDAVPYASKIRDIREGVVLHAWRPVIVAALLTLPFPAAAGDCRRVCDPAGCRADCSSQAPAPLVKRSPYRANVPRAPLPSTNPSADIRDDANSGNREQAFEGQEDPREDLTESGSRLPSSSRATSENAGPRVIAACQTSAGGCYFAVPEPLPRGTPCHCGSYRGLSR